MENICEEIKVPNILETDVPKQMVREAVETHHKIEMKDEMEKLKKLKEIQDDRVGEMTD